MAAADELRGRFLSQTIPQHKRVVGAVLLDAEGRVLLQLRDDKPGLRYPNFWTFFGGAVEDGEAPDEAIQRELAEELDLGDLPMRFWMAYQCPARTIPGLVVTTNFVYIGQMTRPLESLILREGQAMRYFSRAESETLILAFEQSPILAQYFATYGDGTPGGQP
jgi:8-oxo-dGTP diphosphatase